MGYLNMGFSAPPPSSPLSSRGVEDMSHQRPPTCHNPSMRREQDRLDSFHSWTLSIITPAELAKAGFYYLGQGDRVACFSCGGQVCFTGCLQVCKNSLLKTVLYHSFSFVKFEFMKS